MPSIRRTARITESTKLLSAPVATKSTPRGYVAVNMSLDSRTDMVECTARKDMTITGEHGASVSLKAGEKFTMVRAASLGENMWYIVRHVSGIKKCSCAASKPCKHEIHVAALGKVKQAETSQPASYTMSEAKLAALSGASVEAKEEPDIFSDIKKSSQSLIFSKAEVAPEANAALKSEALKKNIGSTVAKAKSMLDAPLNKQGFSFWR